MWLPVVGNETPAIPSERDLENEAVKPMKLRGWPTDRKQALVYLARPGASLLEIRCGRDEVSAALAPHYETVVGTEISAVRALRACRGLAHSPPYLPINQ
jgi:hypothetical protein